MTGYALPSWAVEIDREIRRTGSYPEGYHPLEVRLTCRLMLDAILALKDTPELAAARKSAIASVERLTGRDIGPDRLRSARLASAFGSHTAAEWEAILAKHRNRCVACGSTHRIQKDHIVPLCAGGSDLASNLQPLCKSCNSAKSGRVPVGTQFAIFDRPDKAGPLRT